jgi:hypothetical protein
MVSICPIFLAVLLAYRRIADWLVQGANGPTAAQQAELTMPEAGDALAIRQWEAFLNQDDAKHTMTARCLYEHLFLAHLKFGISEAEEAD